MRGLAIIVVAALAGCGTPQALFCNADTDCIGGRCFGGSCANPDPNCPSGYAYDESGSQPAGSCVDEGSGGSDDVGGGSDGGSGSDDTGGGGMPFQDPVTPVELQFGHGVTSVSAVTAGVYDDITPPCVTTSGRDVMYEVTIPGPGKQRLYLDTSGTSYAPVLAVYAGSCKPGMQMLPGACVKVGCSDPVAPVMQWSANLDPGSYCIVLDQPAATTGTAKLRAMLGPFSGQAEPDVTVISPLCTGKSDWPAYCGTDYPDTTWFYMTCSANWDAYAETSFTGTLEAVTFDGPLTCKPATGDLTIPMPRPGPLWIVAQGTPPTAPCANVSVYLY